MKAMLIENPLRNAPFEALPKPFAIDPTADGMTSARP